MANPDLGPLTPAALHCGILLCLEQRIEITIPYEITENNFSAIFKKFSKKLRELQPTYSQEDLCFKVFLGGGSFKVATNYRHEKKLREKGYEELRYRFSFSPDFRELYITLDVEDEEDSVPTKRTFSQLYYEKVLTFRCVSPFLIFDNSLSWEDVKKSEFARSLIKATQFSLPK